MANEDDFKSRKPPTRGQFSTAEKILLFVAICGFILCVALLVSLGIMINRHKEKSNGSLIESDNHSSTKSHNVCYSLSCQNEASFFLKNIDKNVNPCDDFYQFACGNFIKNAIIPDDTNKIDMLSITQKKVMDELIDEIKGDIKDDEISAFKKLKIFYNNCINKTRVLKEGTTILKNILNDLGDWPVLLDNEGKVNNYVWTDVLYKIKDYGYPVLFPASVYIAIDPKNSTRNIVKISNASTRISQIYFLDGLNSKIIKAYYNYMIDVAVMLGANKDIATREMKDCLNFEIELYKIKSPLEKLVNTTAIYNPMTVDELSKKYPSIPWLEFLNKLLNLGGITINENEVIIADDPVYLSHLEKLMGRTPKKVLVNYLIWQVIYDSVDYLPDNFLDRKLALSRILYGVKERKDRSYTCIREIMLGFPISLSALYVRKHFNETIRESVLELVDNVKNEFEIMLREVDWMDDKTKKAAKEKIKAMDVFIGYSDELFDDEKINDYYNDLVVNEGSYLKSAFNTSLFYTKQYYKNLRIPVNKKDWTANENAAVINAYYYLHKNTFEIPAGFLRGSFFHFDRPKYLNYGAIGSIIGHEITHGFDNEGRKNDKDGNQVNWWEDSTKEKYLKKANCFIEQYDNYTVEGIGLNLNGRRTQSENIADNGGCKVAYRAYNKWTKYNGITEARLPGVNYTARQMFWISAASNWCRKEKIESLKEAVSRDVHSPSAARVDVSFSNIHEFAEDFDCSVGSRMNPERKCVVW